MRSASTAVHGTGVVAGRATGGAAVVLLTTVYCAPCKCYVPVKRLPFRRVRHVEEPSARLGSTWPAVEERQHFFTGKDVLPAVRMSRQRHAGREQALEDLQQALAVLGAGDVVDRRADGGCGVGWRGAEGAQLQEA